ncbi:hypothetical protein [Sandarakinorhabdus sp. DWP1-3-1]|uniref:hypothetical protein n=1 Tax=Sandarakinorhabdus sp. DWP1-3-1 TaxID=2804627 RepID=UPI003CE9D950
MKLALFLVGGCAALAGCAAPQPLVTLAGTPPPPLYAVAGDGPAAAELQRQLGARGLYAADAPTIIHAGYGIMPRRGGACTDAEPAGGCRAWHDVPATGWAPFAPPLRHRLTLVVDGGARIQVVQAGGRDDARVILPALVGLALAQLPTAAPAR